MITRAQYDSACMAAKAAVLNQDEMGMIIAAATIIRLVATLHGRLLSDVVDVVSEVAQREERDMWDGLPTQ